MKKNNENSIMIDEKYNIYYPQSKKRGDFKPLEKLRYIKVLEYNDYEINNERYDACLCIKFDLDYVDTSFIEKIYEWQEEKIKKENITYADVLQQAISYFEAELEEKSDKSLIGDIGEALFLLKCHESGYPNVKNYIRKEDNSLYDFYLNNKIIEVKTTSIDKNEIIISGSQIDVVKQKNIVVCSLKFLENQSTIIDIYEKLKPLPPLLQEKFDKWTHKNNSESIKKFTIVPEKCDVSFLIDDAIPKITITKQNSLNKYWLSVSTPDILKKDFKITMDKLMNS